MKRAFTLIELLVVVAIIAVLSIIVVLTLNPQELLKRSRDSNRLSDLATINSALNVFQADVQGGSLGTASTSYNSAYDPAATSTSGTDCTGLGLPTPNPGYSIHCATSTTYRNTDATGWIPVNFNQITSGRPISSLPIDPQNASSTGSYYSYMPASSAWKLSAVFESSKYATLMTNDGGSDFGTYEFGGALSLPNWSRGLVRYYTGDDSGNTTADSSGGGDTMSLFASSTPTDLHTSTVNCLFSTCLSFLAGSSTYGISSSIVTSTNNMTFMGWVYVSGQLANQDIITGNNLKLWTHFIGGSSIDFRFTVGNVSEAVATGYVGLAWYHIAGVQSSSTIATIYVNGVQQDSENGNGVTAGQGGSTGSVYNLGRLSAVGGAYYKGVLDDARVYNRALSAQEILAIYNATHP